jgi:hypothetical protein
MNEGAVKELRSPEKVAIDFKKLVQELQHKEQSDGRNIR